MLCVPGSLYHSGSHERLLNGQQTGENCGYAWSSGGSQADPRWPVDAWYSEIKDYNFGYPGFSGQTGISTHSLIMTYILSTFWSFQGILHKWFGRNRWNSDLVMLNLPTEPGFIAVITFRLATCKETSLRMSSLKRERTNTLTTSTL